MSDIQIIHLTIPPEMAGDRLDHAISEQVPDYSRSRLTRWIKDGLILVDGSTVRPRDKVKGGEQVEIRAVAEANEDWEAEAIPLDIIYEDDSLIVINKQAGLVAHPAPGNRGSTLVNALLHHDPGLSKVPRAGVVHRLDKETTGLTVIARTLASHTALVAALQNRDIHRHYETIVRGTVISGGRIEAPIGRHPKQRTRQAVVDSGKPAVTHYRVAERYRAHTLLKVQLETGRTHQIRVHMAHIRHAVLGDPVYGGRLQLPKGCNDELRDALRAFKRQALHAAKLGLTHPVTGETLLWQAPRPDDMKNMIQILRADTSPP